MLCKEKYVFQAFTYFEARFRAIIRYFAPDLPASNIAELSGAARRLISYSRSYESGSPRFVTLHHLYRVRLKSKNLILAHAAFAEKGSRSGR